ncbi:MAG: DsrE family protein [Myxococcales bacterium]|nr:DsrE family protein [Myxococcales bacterium]
MAVFLHSGDYDRMHQGLSIATAASAAGRQVEVFFFWWALERLWKDELDEPDFGPGREEAVNRFEARRMPTLRELLGHLRESGRCTLYACTGSMAAVGAEPAGMEAKVDRLVGWNAILQITAGAERFYL